MYFKLYHNPENKTLTIPRAALQLSGLADAEELILHTGGGYVLAARNALSTLECLHLLQFLTSTAASLLLQLAVFSQEGSEFSECGDTLDEEDEMDDPGLTIPACLLELAGLDEADSLDLIYITQADAMEEAKKLAETIRHNYKVGEIRFSTIGPVIGCHTGPGTMALVFFGRRSDAR